LLSAKFHVALIVTVLRLPHGEGPLARAFIRSLDGRRPPVKKIALEEHVRDETQITAKHPPMGGPATEILDRRCLAEALLSSTINHTGNHADVS
jgi:hypothetical protein